MSKLRSTQTELNPPLPPYHVVGVIKFGVNPQDISREEFFKQAGTLIKDMVKKGSEMPFEWDKVLIIGTVKGVELNMIQFIKFDDNKELTLSDTPIPEKQ
jgi:hypothetical protein